MTQANPNPHLYDWIDNLEPPDSVDFAETNTEAGYLTIGSVTTRLSSFMDDNNIEAIFDRLAAADPGPAHQADINTLRHLFLCK